MIAILLLAWGFVLWGMLVWAAGEIAEAKGRGGGNWMLLAAAYGILAVIAIYCLPPIRRQP